MDPNTISLEDRIKGGFWGLLIGDALGVPYEFNVPTAIPNLVHLKMSPPPGFRRTYPQIPPGTWSDDGAQALCLLDTLLECQTVDPQVLMQKFSDWYQHGYLAVDGQVFDVGVQTSESIRKFINGVHSVECSVNHENKNGNGSLMRALPLALWHQGSDLDLIQMAKLQSTVTHAHLRSQICCQLYCLWARRIIQLHLEPWSDAVKTLRSFFPNNSSELAELEFHIRPDDPPQGKGGGYVVDSLKSVLLALKQPTYSDVIKFAIQLGNDTDTTACIAGGIAGLRDGIHAIPVDWLLHLRGKELAQPLLDKLLMHHNT